MTRQRRRPKQGLYLLDRAGVRAVLRHRLRSRDWWLFVTAGTIGLELVATIESKHFRGKASKDFELLMMPAFRVGLGVIGVCLAKKSRLTLAHVLRQLDEQGLHREAETLAKEGQDVIALVPDEATGMRVLYFLAALLGEAPAIPR